MQRLLGRSLTSASKAQMPAPGKESQKMLIPVEGTIQANLTQHNFLTWESRARASHRGFREVYLWGRECTDSYNLLSGLFKSQIQPRIHFNNLSLFSCVLSWFLSCLWRILLGVMNSVSSRRPPLCVSYPKHFLLFGPWFIRICHYAYKRVTTSLEPGKCPYKFVTWWT